MIEYLISQALVFLQPVGMAWVGLVLLTAWLWRKKVRGPAWLSTALVAFLYLFGATDFPGWILRSIERPWAKFDPATAPQADATVLLGGGLEPVRYEVGGLHLTRAGDRPWMALELIRLKKSPLLIIGGSRVRLDGIERVEADLARDAIQSRGLSAAPVVSLGACSNTRDEAIKVAAILKERGLKKVHLVTSAAHMRRAVRTFHGAGVEVIPAPCNFMTSVSSAEPPFIISLPGPDGFNKFAIWFHETVGTAIYARRGWLAPE